MRVSFPEEGSIHERLDFPHGLVFVRLDIDLSGSDLRVAEHLLDCFQLSFARIDKLSAISVSQPVRAGTPQALRTFPENGSTVIVS